MNLNDALEKRISKEEAVMEARRCLQCTEEYCSRGCPAGIDVRGFIAALATEDIFSAIKILWDQNIFPLSCALLCPVEKLCEEKCCSSKINYPIMIHRLQRFVAEYAFEKGLLPPKKIAKRTGKKIAVIGSGPAGLSAAAELATLGETVTIYEASEVLGGMLLSGIPRFRLPSKIPYSEIDYIQKVGVTIRLNSPITDLESIFEDGYDAIFLATGLGESVMLDVPGNSLKGVYTAIDFLREVNRAFDGFNFKLNIGEKVVVIGGGAVAMDVACSSFRLGAESVEVVCLEGPNEMPAHRKEIYDAWRRGVIFHCRAKPTEVVGHGEKVAGLKGIRIVWEQPGLPSNAVEIKGTEFFIPADTIVVAIGERPNAWTKNLIKNLRTKDGRVVVDQKTFATSKRGVFAGGDIIINGGGTIVKSLSEGKVAARSIHKYVSSTIGS